MIAINYLAVGASAVAAFIVGFIWYGAIFAKLWSEGHGFTQEKATALQKSAPIAAGISFIGYLITAYILALLFHYMNISDMKTALWVTFLIWLGFPAMIGLMNSLYAGRSLVVYLIDVFYQLIYLLLTAVFLMTLK